MANYVLKIWQSSPQNNSVNKNKYDILDLTAVPVKCVIVLHENYDSKTPLWLRWIN